MLGNRVFNYTSSIPSATHFRQHAATSVKCHNFTGILAHLCFAVNQLAHFNSAGSTARSVGRGYSLFTTTVSPSPNTPTLSAWTNTPFGCFHHHKCDAYGGLQRNSERNSPKKRKKSAKLGLKIIHHIS